MKETHIKISGVNAQGEINSNNTSIGALRILVERHRVMDEKEVTPTDDLGAYENDELVYAALAYIQTSPQQYYIASADIEQYGVMLWPWRMDSYKGGKDRIADLVRAGQFIAAEIDRLLLEAENSKNPTHGKPGEPGITITPPGATDNSDELRMTPENSFEPGNGSDPATWFEGMLDRPDSTKD